MANNPGDGSGVGGRPIARRQDGLQSVGAGSNRINDESSTFKTKDLHSPMMQRSSVVGATPFLPKPHQLTRQVRTVS